MEIPSMGSAERESYHAGSRLMAAGDVSSRSAWYHLGRLTPLVKTLRSYGVNEQEVAADDLAAMDSRSAVRWWTIPRF
jgi:hypothetical protein